MNTPHKLIIFTALIFFLGFVAWYNINLEKDTTDTKPTETPTNTQPEPEPEPELEPEPEPEALIEKVVADFHLEIETWYASDKERTEYVSVKLIHNGTVRAEKVIIRGGGLGFYIQEEFDWLDPLEVYRYHGLTENREDDFGGLQVIWEYIDEHNETVVAVKDWRYGRYGINLVNSSARTSDLLPSPEIVDYQQFVNDEGYIAVQINVKNDGKAGNILITILFQGYDGISLWDRTDEMKVWIDEGESHSYIHTTNMRPSTHTTIGVSNVSVSSSRAFLN